MYAPDLISLMILPAVIWASRMYVALSNSQIASNLRSAGSAKTKRELVEVAKWGTLYIFVIYFIGLGCILFLDRTQDTHAVKTILNPQHWERMFFHGIILGLSLVGVLMIFRIFFPEARRFGFLVMAGIASPPLIRVSTLLLVICTEELWRAVCLTILIGHGFFGPQAVLVTSVAYGLAYLGWGYRIALSDGIIGAVYGGLFIWSGSFFVPFAAHTVLRGQELLYAIAASPDAQPGEIYSRPHTKCPACNAVLNFRQVNLNPNESFFCPSCHVRITISDERRRFLRWGFIFLFVPLLIATFDLFPRALRGREDQYWLSLGVALCAGLGLQVILRVMFPPQLVCGDPDFVSLNLRDKDAAQPEERKMSRGDESGSK